MAIGQDFYPDSGLRDVETLSRTQSVQALGYGDQAARYADPFMDQRGQYQNMLSKAWANPGSMTSNPAYQAFYNQGLNALQRKGNVRSGRKLADLMDYGQQRASQFFFPMVDRLSNLAMSGSSPGAAGLAYARGTERSQDYAQLAAAAKGAGRGAGGAPASPQTPWWQQPMQMPTTGSQSAGWGSSNYGMPAGGGSYAPSTYTPSSMAGTGYVSTGGYGDYDYGSGYDSYGSGGYGDYDYGSGYDNYGGGYEDYGSYDYGE